MNRILSLVVVGGYCWVAVHTSEPLDARGIAASVVLILLSLALIWFGDTVGEWTGFYVGRGGMVDVPTPGFLLKGAGWFLLLLPVWFLLVQWLLMGDSGSKMGG